MRPILYSPETTTFNNNGIGTLHDCVTCFVEEERNGVYECTLTYPVDGIHYDGIEMRGIIKAKPNQTDDPQPFRIYSISKPLKGIVTVKAAHLSYDLSGIAVSPFTSVGITQTLGKLKSEAVVEYPFEFHTDKDTETQNFVNAVPRSVRSVMGGMEGSILDVFGTGEYYYNGYQIWLYVNRGANRGVVIRYGKNLTNLKQDENCASVYTAVYPYWVDSQTGAVTEIDGKLVQVEGSFGYTKILPLDLSSDFQEQPTEEQLINRTNRYITENSIGVPKVSLSVNFQQLSNYDGYEDMNLLERVSLCDTVTISFPKLGVNATAKAVKVKYNCLLERVETVTLGQAKANMSDAMVSARTDIEERPTVSRMRATAESVTNDILGATNGAIRFIDADGDGQNDTLYIADNADPANAIKVWRWNYEGWAASTNGYAGPFTLGATLDSGILANFITAGELDASLIKVGIIQALNNKFWMNIENGTFNFGDNKLSYDGATLNISADTINIAGNAVATEDVVDSSIESAVSGVNTNVSNLSNTVNTLQNDFDEFADEYSGFIKIETNVPRMTLGKANTASNVQITNTDVTIEGSGNARAVLGSSKFTVGQVAANALILGDSAWEVRSNGHISLKKVGG